MRISAPSVMRTGPRDYYVSVQRVGVRLPWPERRKVVRRPEAWELERDAYLAERLAEVGQDLSDHPSYARESGDV